MIKILMTAATLTVLPGLAIAMCSGTKHEDMAMSCAEGSTWDAASRTCVSTATS